jgi:predicted CoA-binding protein
VALRDRTVIPAKVGRGYRVDEILDELDDQEDRDALLGWLNDPTIGSKRIANELVDEGYTICPNAIAYYRRKVLEVDV